MATLIDTAPCALLSRWNKPWGSLRSYSTVTMTGTIEPNLIHGHRVTWMYSELRQFPSGTKT